MGSHPINLGLRFLLEIAALAAMAMWAYRLADGWLRFVLVIAVPLLAAGLWGTFRIPNDPGPAPVAVPGALRLLLELAFFAFAVWALFQAGFNSLAWGFAVVVALHYIISYDRILWMLKH